ncbi:MAG: 1-acyl-sn-glycerol-3-phosphate acyltransferase [Bacteroidota bacterium]
MHTTSRYAPILPDAKDWPVVQLNKHRRAFVQSVIDQSVQTLLDQYPSEAARWSLLEKTLDAERARIKRQPWRVDPADEQDFWQRVAVTVGGQRKIAPAIVLQRIVKRYAWEIAGRFRISHYRFVSRVATYTLARLLHPVKLVRPRLRSQLQDKLTATIPIVGAVDQLRQLARQGTIVMVPTHFSHLDSLLVGWVINTLGLPPFIYGAGLNLYNSKFFAYFLDKIGTFKIDRRKKNLPYLTTLKAYSSLAIQQGCHSLFYPGGTRSRSGAIEQKLKLGLLETAIDAQRCNYQTHGPAGRKIFVVPIVFNYAFVPEALTLIQEHLAAQGQSLPKDEASAQSQLYDTFKLAATFLTKGSNITVSIGTPMDLLGNPVDEKGDSHGPQGEYIDFYTQFRQGASPAEGQLKDEQYTKQLGEAILKAYHKANCVLTSHLVAFVAFALIQKKNATLAWDALIERPADSLLIPYADFERNFGQLRAVLLQRASLGEVQVEQSLQAGDLAGAIQYGLDNLGIYHTKRPLVRNSAGDFTTQDLRTLLYYHNRLTGYDLEEHLA